jgi:hypothetical protein
MKLILHLFVLSVSALLLSSPCWAYYEVLDTGEVLAPGHHKITGGLQALTDDGGANMTGIFDTGLQQDWGLRGIVGFGKTDYSLGGMVKWVPIPDVEGQPAVGLNAGLTYARWNDANELTFRFEPLVSKKFMIDTAAITPYASVPIGVRVRNSNRADVDDDTQTTFQLALGSQLQVEQLKNLQFIAELGLDLDHAFPYVSVGALFYFDNENGFVWE